MKHAKHIVRAILIIAIVGVGGFFARYLEIPPSFGDLGHYRAESVLEQRSLEVRHGKVGACAECHGEIAKMKEAGVHKNVVCENCHEPLSVHVRDGKKIAEMPRMKVAALCTNCHQKLHGRPADHAQIDIRQHLDDGGMKWHDAVCYECHNHHDPKKDMK